jgi:fucose 4-O-acetylase-like acetyltransferase
MKTRNIALDYAKGIAIVLVVHIHLWGGLTGAGLLSGINPVFVSGIDSAFIALSMPTFFTVSGLLYGQTVAKRHGLREFAGKVDAIFYPYLIWSIIIGLFELLGGSLRNHGASASDLLDILWNPHGIFWFLYTLLLAFGAMELMIRLFGVTVAKLIAVPIGLLLLGFYADVPQVASMPEFCKSFIYFAIGVVLATRLPSEQKPSWIWVCVLLLAILMVQVGAHVVVDGSTHSHRSVTPNAFPAALITVFLLLGLCYRLPLFGMSWLATLGERSMDIYLVHLLFVAPIRIVLQKLFGLQSIPAYMVIGMVLGVVGPLIMTSVLKRGLLGVLFKPPVALSLKRRFFLAPTKEVIHS